MAEIRKMPIGGQSFQVLRENNFVYVDKTQYAYQLISQSRVYFLSRPRRFGKSLFLSTLKAYFLGQKELFKGLYLEKAEAELAQQEGREAWQEYPVLYLDFNAKNYENKEALTGRLELNLQEWEKRYSLEKINDSLEERFAHIIRGAYEKTGQLVVVLIDEYDKPLLDTIDDNELNETYRDILKAFFSVIKSCDQYLRFAFLTGVTKFSKVSVFSGLNNLRDLSLLSSFSSICGITEKEVETNFDPELEALANTLGLSKLDTLQRLKENYDGYLFAKEGESVYNPFSLLNVFAAQELENYWYATGTPTFLVKYLKEAHYYIPELDGKVELDAASLDGYRVDIDNVLPILFQAGYLTIKGYDEELKLYRLGYPNNEVRTGFLKNLLPSFSSIPEERTARSIADFYRDLRAGNVEDFMRRMQALMSTLPYDTAPANQLKWRERDYQIVVYLVFALMGQYVQTEVVCAGGRADCVLQAKDAIYVFEFKLWSNGTPEDAIAQIRDRGYALPYQSSGKRVVLVGASFDEQKRTLAEWKMEEL